MITPASGGTVEVITAEPFPADGIAEIELDWAAALPAVASCIPAEALPFWLGLAPAAIENILPVARKAIAAEQGGAPMATVH